METERIKVEIKQEHTYSLLDGDDAMKKNEAGKKRSGVRLWVEWGEF